MALVAAGPLIAALAGAGAGAATGGIVGGLIGLGVEEHHAKRYQETIEGGGVVVAVATEGDEEAERAEYELKEAGALEVEREPGRPVRAR